MAMPSLGQLSLFDAGKEVVVGAREAPIADSTVLLNFPNGISLTEISTGTGAAADDPINWRNTTNAPNEQTPHALSEFYGYDDDYIFTFNTSTNVGYYYRGDSDTNITVDTVYGRISRGFTSTTNTDNIDPIAKAGYKWRELTFKVSAGQSVLYRPVIIFRAAGTDYRRDFAFNSLRSGTTHYYAGNTASVRFENASSDALPISESSWTTVTTGSTAGRFNIENGGGTPSTGTGPDTGLVYSSITGNYETTTGPYWYYESSSSATGWAMWKPSATKSIGGGSTDTWTLIYSAWSDNVVTWDNCYFEIVIQVTAII